MCAVGMGIRRYIVGMFNKRRQIMSVVTITISIDTGKETPAQRKVRIAETQNGRKTRTRTIPNKRKKEPKYKKFEA